MVLSLSLMGCLEPKIDPNPLIGLDDSTFQGEEEYSGELNTIGDLSTAYTVNTYALRVVNNKLDAICVASYRCENQNEE